MPQADKQAGTVLGTVLGIGVIGTIVVVTIINKCGQISKHIDATTPLDTTPAYSLIHTDGPSCTAPTVPSSALPQAQTQFLFTSSSALPPDPVYPTASAPGNIYADAYQLPMIPPSQQYPPADPVYPTLPSAPPAYIPSEDPPMNTIDYKGPYPEIGKTLEFKCLGNPQTRREIQYIQINNSPSEVYELTDNNICPGGTSTFTDKYGNTHTIKWINP